MLRPKKVYQMLASRACRTSVMIGDTLDIKKMSSMVSNLANLESPWNCPHGRPTIRLVKKIG
jgi:DNA mismatch repair protein PMS2